MKDSEVSEDAEENFGGGVKPDVVSSSEIGKKGGEKTLRSTKSPELG